MAAPAAYVCYVLACEDGSRTYCGITNNPVRRLRQHNGELAGGARYTRGRRWAYLFRDQGFRGKREVLSFEWHLKHRSRRCRGDPRARRARARDALLALPRWAHLRKCAADAASAPDEPSPPPEQEGPTP
jgi:predicted GIY-YIG superfamily endonuclease